MSDVSIAEAKSNFAHLVQQAEGGQAVRITRRGKPVAVLVSEACYAQLQSTQGNWVAFSRAWREGMQAEGQAFLAESELQGLRPTSGRQDLDLG